MYVSEGCYSLLTYSEADHIMLLNITQLIISAALYVYRTGACMQRRWHCTVYVFLQFCEF